MKYFFLFIGICIIIPSNVKAYDNLVWNFWSTLTSQGINRNAMDAHAVGQKFTAGWEWPGQSGNYSLDKACFILNKVGTLSGCNIWAILRNSNRSSVLATSDTRSVSILDGNLDYKCFNFSTPYTATFGTSYNIEITNDCADSTSNYMTVSYCNNTGSNIGAANFYTRNSDNTFTDQSGYDTAVAIINIIPTPTSAPSNLPNYAYGEIATASAKGIQDWINIDFVFKVLIVFGISYAIGILVLKR